MFPLDLHFTEKPLVKMEMCACERLGYATACTNPLYCHLILGMGMSAFQLSGTIRHTIFFYIMFIYLKSFYII